MYVRFGGERLETCRSSTVRRWALTLLYISVAPVPFATLSNREWGSIGSNYIKGLCALAFQGFFIMVCVGIYSVLVASVAVASNLHTALWSVAAYTVILCFSLFKTGSLAKSVLNAH